MAQRNNFSLHTWSGSGQWVPLVLCVDDLDALGNNFTPADLVDSPTTSALRIEGRRRRLEVTGNGTLLSTLPSVHSIVKFSLYHSLWTRNGTV